MKRIAVMLLIVSIALSGFAASAAAARFRISDLNAAVWEDAQALANANAAYGRNEPVGDLESLAVTAGDEVRIYLSANMFVDADGGKGAADQGVTLSQLQTGRITLFSSVTAGDAAIEDIGLEYERGAGILPEGASYIRIAFSDPYVNLEETAFSCTVRLKVRGESREETEIHVSGVLDNDRILVDGGTDYLSLEGGAVAEMLGLSQGCQVDLGNGFSITVNLYKNQEYYGAASIEQTVEDTELMAEHSEIAIVYHIYQINLDHAASVCRFDLPDAYLVYDSQGRYLGTTKDDLPFAEQYYLTTEALRLPS